MKKFVIVKPGCKEFANHLLTYMSIYTAGLALGARVVNPSFYAYHHFFSLVHKESFLTRLLSFLATWIPFPRLWQAVYAVYARSIGRAYAPCVTHAWRGLVYLPPTQAPFEKAEKCATTYFFGWLYRNPKGLAQYRSTLLEAFAPRTAVREKIQKCIAHTKGRIRIGIHIRQEPYTGFPDGEFLIAPNRVREILHEYLEHRHLTADDVTLIVVCDDALPKNTFTEFTTTFFKKRDALNLFVLSECDVVIGTNSTFPFLSAWFGNIPHIVTTNEKIDWEYYRGKETYFENKYATFVLGMPAAQSVHEPHAEA